MNQLITVLLLTSFAAHAATDPESIPRIERATVEVLQRQLGNPELGDAPFEFGNLLLRENAHLLDSNQILYFAEMGIGLREGFPQGNEIPIASNDFIRITIYLQEGIGARPYQVFEYGHPAPGDTPQYILRDASDEKITIVQLYLDGFETRVPFSQFKGFMPDFSPVVNNVGNVVQFSFKEPIPEPSAMWLALAGVLAIGRARR